MPSVACAEEIRTTFASHRYVKIEGLLEDGLRKMLYDWAKRREGVAPAAITPGQEGAVEVYSDQLMEHVLAGIRPRLEELSGLELEPTYSFLRIYRRGNTLHHHKDRAACEVSVSLNLGPALDPPWPLCIKGPLSESAVGMAPGDAVLYRGIECEHWRDALEADETVQVFLHFVERGGHYSDWKSDKRPALGADPRTAAK